MKPDRNHILIALSSIALVILLAIQVNWILQTARIKEELFNEKANIILARTTEAIHADTATSRRMEICVDSSGMRTIDSLLKHYMDFYNFHIDYSFEVMNPRAFPFGKTLPLSGADTIRTFPPSEPGCYQKDLVEVAGKSGIQLKLVFPEKEEFIREEMGVLFITSVVLILIVLVLFWRTILSLGKEKKILEHTRDFLNNMTHEFKTPLTNIALAGRMLLKENMRQEDKTKHYTGIILAENEKLKLQVEQVLSMSALERGEIPLQKTELDLHRLIHDAVKSMSLQIESKEGIVDLKLDAQEFVVLGDRTHLTNALCNLIDNAIKYSDEKPALSIRTSNSGQNLLLEISDKGIGIDKAYHEQVFDKFFRVPTGDLHDVKGFGLGLAYVKKIIELHGGTIIVQSEKEKGTTFSITLPHA